MSGWFWLSYVLLWILTAALLLMCALLFRQLGIVVMGTARGVNDSGIKLGKPLTEVTLETHDGSSWAPSNWNGKPYLVIFAGPFCAECKKLWPGLRTLRQELDVEVMLLLFGTPEDTVPYAEKYRLSPVATITQEEGRAFDVEATPFVYAVDASGAVRMKGLANSPDRLEEMARACSRGVRALSQA